MKLDRNSGPGGGKYAVINMRKAREALDNESHYSGGGYPISDAFEVLESAGLINFGEPRTENEFFVIMLKDRHSSMALTGYAADVSDDPEYQSEIADLALRAGPLSPFCKTPD